MSAEYQGQNPIDIAKQAEADLNSLQAKGNISSKKAGQSDSVNESGIDESVVNKFPGADLHVGGAGRTIPPSEGGDFKANGQPTKAEDFEGVGGPEDKARLAAENRGGDNDVRENIRQGGDTIRPGGGDSNAAQGGAGGRQV